MDEIRVVVPHTSRGRIALENYYGILDYTAIVGADERRWPPGDQNAHSSISHSAGSNNYNVLESCAASHVCVFELVHSVKKRVLQ